MADDKREVMNPYFAVFNLHINHAGKRADEEFKRMFGDRLFEKHIAPAHRAGIMTIFQHNAAKAHPNKYRLAWIALVTAFVNSDLESEITEEHFDEAAS